MSRKIVVEFLGESKGLLGETSKVEARFGKLGGKLERVGAVAGKVLAGGVLVGGAAMVKFGQQASDLAETQSKVQQIFGVDSVKALDKFADGAAKSMGQSKQEALDGLATFGMFGKMAGKSGDDLVGFSSQLSTLASDMASFGNTSPDEAIEAIGAALRGESEPIRKYGVLLDDATLRQEAMKLGLIKTTKEALTPQQKVLAAQSAILKQTKDQQGDFARTSNGLANKQRILKAQFSNVTTELGAAMLPAMVKVTGVALKMINWMERHKKLVGGLVIGLGGLTALVWGVGAAMRAWVAITKVWTAVTIVARNAQMAWNLALTLNPIGLVVAALVALGIGLVIAYKKSETFRKVVNGAFHAIADAAKWMWERVIRPYFKFIIDLWLAVAGAIVHGAAKAFGWVPGLGKKLKGAAKGFDAFRDDVNRSLGGIKDRNVKIKVKAEYSASAAALVGAGKVPGLHRASGGPVAPGATYRVNERGEEYLTMGDKGGFITPAGRTKNNAGGSSISITINTLDARSAGEAVVTALQKWQRMTGQTVPITVKG